MHTFFFPLVLLSLGLAASSRPVISPWTLHERRSLSPSRWSLVRKHDASAVIPLRFALAQSNLENLEEYLYDISHPSSPNYGKHWSPGQVASTFAPSRQTVDIVRGWLVENGIESHRVKLSSSGAWLELKATVQEAEELLLTSYNVYGHEAGTERVGCESYHLPEHLTSHIDFVTPTVHFDIELSKRSSSYASSKSIGLPDNGNGPTMVGELLDLNQLKGCGTHMTPVCLRALYDFYYQPVATKKNSYGITEYTPQTYLQSDLNLFAMNFSADLYGISPIVVSIDGGAFSSNRSFTINGESDLDLEYAMNLITAKQNVTLYQIGDFIQGASFNNFLDALDGAYCTFEGGDDPANDGVYPDKQPGGYDGPEACGTVKPANVISTSYSGNEAGSSFAYSSRQCQEYGKLGLMGVTILYSTGDNGVAGNKGKCLEPNGTESVNGTIFNPTFPGTCPFITAVGATQLYPGQTVSDKESACQEYIQTGGGFSNYFPIPDYQKEAVGSYLKNTPPSYPGNIWNSTGRSRAYPDLSVNGNSYAVVVDGKHTLASGTSASTPVLGAMLAMINDARLAQNKTPIGFINPVIYAANFSDAFNDITNGTNPGCGTLGFNTSKGWDPVTGLGTPIFPKFLEKWLALP